MASSLDFGGVGGRVRVALIVNYFVKRTFIISAGKTIPMVGHAVAFVVVQSPAPLSINYGNGFNTYVQQTGEGPVGPFDLLEINNPNKTDIVCDIWTGTAKTFIDHRNLPCPQQPNVPYVTNIESAAKGPFPIADRTGSIFTDANGVQWYAVQRVSASIFNASFDGSENPIDVEMTWGNGLVVFIPPLFAPFATGPNYPNGSPFTVNFSGAFGIVQLTSGTTTTRVQILETYQAIPIFPN